jgi:hypothetical protein
VAPSPGIGADDADESRHPLDPSALSGTPHPVTGQTCAFCGDIQVVWLHPLASDRVQFRRFGKDDTSPSSWTLCEGCEQLYQNRRDDELIALMRDAGGWIWQGTDVEDVLRKPVDVFREADLGRRPIADG